MVFTCAKWFGQQVNVAAPNKELDCKHMEQMPLNLTSVQHQQSLLGIFIQFLFSLASRWLWGEGDPLQVNKYMKYREKDKNNHNVHLPA